MKLQGTVPLETGRLVLRRFLPGDAPAVFHGWAGREDCCRYLPWEPCAALQETQVRLENWLGRYAEPDFLQWAVTLRESGTLASSICTAWMRRTAAPRPPMLFHPRTAAPG